MDTFSAVLGDLLSRCISFAIDRCHQQHQGVEEEGNLQRLRRVLLRIQAVVEEADGRCITNRVMLQQLSTLRDAMYRGCYFLDNSRCRTIQAHATDEVGDHSPGLSPFSPLKRLCISTGAWKILPRAVEKNELQRMLDHLETVVSDMQEFVVFVSSYPRVPRQPYCSYLLLENCMFGRQAEQERVIKFLLEPRPPGAAKGIDVLPIIGPGGVGKSTLVEHVCFDERVRRCFSTIVYYGPDSIRGGNLTVLADTGMIKHRNPVTTEQSLVIIEPGNDMDDETWRGILHSLRDGHITTVSKIIITSRSKEMATFGTTEALQLDFLTKEAFWYFFKTIVFGSTNPEEEPKLASICMELATMVDGSFMGAHIFGDILRSNFSAQFWYRFLKCYKFYTDMHVRQVGEHPSEVYRGISGRTSIWTSKNRFVTTATYAVTYRLYEASSANLDDQSIVPVNDVFIGNFQIQGKIDVLLWRSKIPPYYSYIAHYEVLARQPQMLPNKRKRSRPLAEGLV